MLNFLKYRFQMEKITAEQLASYVPRWITAEQYQEITGVKYSA